MVGHLAVFTAIFVICVVWRRKRQSSSQASCRTSRSKSTGPHNSHNCSHYRHFLHESQSGYRLPDNNYLVSWMSDLVPNMQSNFVYWPSCHRDVDDESFVSTSVDDRRKNSANLDSIGSRVRPESCWIGTRRETDAPPPYPENLPDIGDRHTSLYPVSVSLPHLEDFVEFHDILPPSELVGAPPSYMQSQSACIDNYIQSPS